MRSHMVISCANAWRMESSSIEKSVQWMVLNLSSKFLNMLHYAVLLTISIKGCIMWVRIKGVLYNLSLVRSIEFNARTHFIQLFFTGVVPTTNGSYRNDTAWIEFDNNEDALLAYKHIIRTIDIPQLKQEDFHG